jgi:hypothetical protein
MVPTILATACVGQNVTCHLGQPECVVAFAISQQPSIGGHQGAAKLEHQAAVEVQPNSIRSRLANRRWLAFSPERNKTPLHPDHCASS